MSWIDDLLDETRVAEAPTSYFYWSALTLLSATVGRSVYVTKRKLFKVYPNLFVFLVSKRSGLGKGFPVSVAQTLASRLGHSRLIIGQASIEGIIKELANVHTTATGRVINTAEAYMIAPEFGSFLLNNPQLFTQLTDLYDSMYHKDWVKTLAHSEKSKLKDLCLTGLFAANEVHFNQALPMHAKKGGFLGRVIVIHESKERQLEPAIRPPKDGEAKEIDYDKLLMHLKLMTQIHGEFTIEGAAMDMYEEWYFKFYGKDQEDDTGTAPRMKDNILKVGMLLSLADELNLFMTEQHMKDAIINCTSSFKSTKRMLVGEGEGEKSKERRKILSLLIQAKDYTMSRKDLLIKGHGDFDVYDLERAMETFLQAEIIRVRNKGSNQLINLTEKGINLLCKFEEGKQEESNDS